MTNAPDFWTPQDVADRFKEAARTLRRLPNVRVRGYFNAWPTIIRTAREVLDGEVMPMRLGPPSAEAISRMEETIQWVFFLIDEDDRRLIWLRASGVPWKPICWQLGICRTNAHNKWKAALLTVATCLNYPRNGGRNA